MTDSQVQGPQVDVGVIIKKLQDRLSEAMTTIMVLEAQLEMVQAQQGPHTHDDEEAASAL